MLVAFAKSVEVLIAARLVAGLADGFVWVSIPVYLGEIAEPRIRGFLGSGAGVAWIFGMLLMNIIGSYLTIRTVALISSTFPLLLLMTFSWMPESPYYFLLKNETDSARRSLKMFNSSRDADEELKRILEAIEEQRRSKGNFLDLFTIQSNRKALVVVLGTRTVQQFSGVTAFMFYAQIIFEEASDTISPTTSSIIYFAMQFLVAGLAASIVDKSGRKPLMIISLTGSALALFTEACYFYIQNATEIDVSDFGAIPVAALIFYVVVFSIGMQTIPVLLLGELFPTSVKAAAVGLADIYLGFAMTVVSKFFQATKDEFGLHVPFLAFTVFCILGVVFITFYVPETKGKTLEEIQEELKFRKPKPVLIDLKL